MFSPVAEIDSAAVWGLIGAAITAAGAVIVNIVMTRHKIAQDERADLRNEWKELSERQTAQIVTLQARVEKVEGEKADCERERANLQTRVAVLEMKAGIAPKGGG